jgi:hypothetical protein
MAMETAPMYVLSTAAVCRDKSSGQIILAGRRQLLCLGSDGSLCFPVPRGRALRHSVHRGCACCELAAWRRE